MAGTINLALTQQFDMDGRPLSGGLLYFFAAGSTTPQSAFQDSGLTIVFPNPIVLDASGRVPMFYLASTAGEGNPSGQIKIRLANKSGVTVIAADQLLIIGPAGGGGGSGGGVDPSTIMATGDVKARYGTGPLDGYCRCNGLTIGKTGSGATERAADLCQALFEYLWPFPNITLDSASKGATANADWLAGRKLILPDLKGRGIVGMDDMGSTAANRLTSTYWGANATILGAAGGDEKHLLAVTEVPAHTHTGSGTTGSENATITHSFSGSGTTGSANSSMDHTHNFTASVSNSTGGAAQAVGAGATTSTTGGSNNSLDHTHNFSVSGTTGGQNQNHQHPFSFTTASIGGGLNHAIASPSMAMTIYIKL